MFTTPENGLVCVSPHHDTAIFFLIALLAVVYLLGFADSGKTQTDHLLYYILPLFHIKTVNYKQIPHIGCITIINNNKRRENPQSKVKKWTHTQL